MAQNPNFDMQDGNDVEFVKKFQELSKSVVTVELKAVEDPSFIKKFKVNFLDL